MDEKLTFSLDGNNILRSEADGLAPQKGSEALPYTVSEYEVLVESGEWNGGFVERLGMVESQSMPSDGTDGYYSDWDFDISDYTGRDDDNPKYKGSVWSKKNVTDCAYRCIACCLEGISSVGVGDLYGDWAISKGYAKEGDVNDFIAKGMDTHWIGNFVGAIVPKFGKTLETVNPQCDLNEYFAENPNVKAMAMVHIEGSIYHEVIVKGVSSSLNLIYDDPQNPSNTAPLPQKNVKTILAIKNR